MSLVSERVPVRQKGKDFWACCPLHNEKTPSFKVDPSTQLWHCFGCGEGGGVFDFIMKLDDLSFPESVRKLAERAHIEIVEKGASHEDSSNRNRLKDACKEAATFYHMQLMRGRSKDASDARAYLGSRGLGGEVPKKWNLGYAPGGSALVHHLTSKGFTAKEMLDANLAVSGDGGRLRDRFYKRAMFPIRDITGDVIAFGGRIIDGNGPKYLNSQETPIFHKSQVLFGLDMAKAQMASTGQAIVTEGYTDVIAMHEAGLKNAVASLGTSLTSSHVRSLSRHAGKSIVYIFDGDEAGQRATERALQFIDKAITPEFGSKMIDIRALSLPDGLDPADYLEKHGPDEMKKLIDDAKPLVLFGIERRIDRHDISSPEGRAQAANDALEVLAPIKDSILAKDYARQIASMLNLHEEDVVGALASIPAPRRYEPEERETQQPAQISAMRALSTPKLAPKERNRIKMERELLGICAQNPALSIANAEHLQEIAWRDTASEKVARKLLETLLEHPGISASELIAEIGADDPSAVSFLTAAQVPDEFEVEDMVGYLCDDLKIGDLERKLAQLKGTLARSGPAQDVSDIFKETAKLQSKLNDMKNSHKLPE